MARYAVIDSYSVQTATMQALSAGVREPSAQLALNHRQYKCASILIRLHADYLL
jgi:hypothetical protein